MIDLKVFFTLPFNRREISLTELLAFAAANLSAMIAAGGSQLTQRVNATTLAINALELKSTDAIVKNGAAKAMTQAKEAFRKSLPSNVEKIYGAVLAEFGSGSTQMTQVFPEGRAIFTTCRDEQLNNYLEGLVTTVVTLEAQLGENATSNAGALRSNWIAITAAQDSAKQARRQVKSSITDLRGALEMELYKNVLTLALAFPNQPEKAPIFCPQELLTGRQSATVVDQATLTAGAYDEVLRQVTLTAGAEGAVTLSVQRRLSGESEWLAVAEGLVPVEGVASYVDTVPAPGSYEYQAYGVNGSKEGEPSAMVQVTAT